MKKILLVAALVLGITAAASAQPRALGIRGLLGAELSYQHNLGSANFLEADLGLGTLGGNYLNVSATYNFMIAEFGDGFGFSAGPGAALSGGNDLFGVGIAGQVGIEYTFHFPLQLSIDWRPQIGLWSGGFNLWGYGPALGVRYRF